MHSQPIILVADDDDSVREMLLEYLAGAGFAVRQAASAAALLSELARAPADLLLLDRSMPGGDTLRLVPTLRRKHPALGIVVLTALAHDDDRVHGLEFGADDYVGKPFNWRELTARIHAVLRRARREAPLGASLPRRDRRREAAILFADVAGFTRLMHDDEAATLRVLHRYLHDVVTPGLAAHGGRLVKTLGDGFLAELPSGEAAVACALALQQALAKRNKRLPVQRRLQFRIGIHIARVVVTADGDLLGDGVNFAARLQAEAAPGGIVVSAAVHAGLPSGTATLLDLGDRSLKNVAGPQNLYAVEAAPAARRRNAGLASYSPGP